MKRSESATFNPPRNPSGNTELDKILDQSMRAIIDYKDPEQAIQEVKRTVKSLIDQAATNRCIAELEALKPLIHPHDGNDMVADILNDRIAELKEGK